MRRARTIGRTSVETLERRALFAATPGGGGGLDPSFGNGGQLVVNVATQSDAAIDQVALDDGSSLLLGQHFPSPQSSVFSTVSRVTSAGALDPAFGVGGVAELSQPGGMSMVVTPAGQIVVAGATLGAGTPSADGPEDLLLQRLNADGSVDTTFGTGGITTTDTAHRQDAAVKLLQQADGKLVVVGYEQKAFLSRVQQSPHIIVTRYDADGHLDGTFGTNGVVVTDLPRFDIERAASAALQADGKIVVVGTAAEREAGFNVEASPARILVLRYNANGTLDNTFSKDGVAVSRRRGAASDVRVEANRILVSASRTVAGGRVASVLAFKLNGAVSAGFGANGVATADYRKLLGTAARNDTADRLAIDSTGKIVLAGRAGTDAIGVARLTAKGRADPSFGTRGKSVTVFTAVNNVTMAVQIDDKILTASGGTDITIARLLAVAGD
ncbi:hypothetical protein [Humisphaera borealis]|uniref:Delta-60 repeat domain-containing protein n=1 Tax=Humisphaera borealis TaxID=2807512 RepID=A0A7M2WV78_9BACT|nr:hypothetical protein [Humisphaera borealis]QOV89395.1 hypothetical protein IPV69_24875 [Humisphaera borealis]